jgi:3-hydroxyacyl-[acyl-carrier-protein] dehydratase
MEGSSHVFTISLLPDYCAYKGHFPDNPIAPGVCNIQMFKELAERVTEKKLLISYIAKCRFLIVINPLTVGELEVSFELTEADVDGILSLTGTLIDVSRYTEGSRPTCMELKVDFTLKQ